MEKNVQARIDFIDQAAKGQYSRAQAEEQLLQMEQEFGSLAFLPGSVTRKAWPWTWTQKHLDELKRDAVCGAGSREFLSYLAQVGRAVYLRKRIQSGLLWVIGILAGVLLVLWFLSMGNEV